MALYNYSNKSKDTIEKHPKNAFNSKQIAYKGLTDDFSQSVDVFNRAITKLSDNAHMMIADLDRQSRSDFNHAVRYLQVMHNKTPYRNAVSRIRQHFGTTNKYNLGTVGHFFTGCKKNEYGERPSCDINCVSTFDFDNGDVVKCDDNIIIGEWKNGQYHFKSSQKADTNRAILFINDDEFRGFSKTEINIINRYFNINSIAIYICADGFENCPIDVDRKFIQLNDIKMRIIDDNVIVNQSMPYASILLILLIFAIIILFFMYRRRN